MCSQRQKPVRKNPPFSHLFIWDTVRNCPMTVQDAVKMQRVSFHLHFGNEDTDMEQYSAHNNTCKTQKFHYTTNTQQPVQMLLGNESKRHIKCTVGGLFGLLLCISGYGGCHPNGKMPSVGEGGAKLYPQLEFQLSKHNIKHTL